MAKIKFTREEALAFHLEPTPGKWEVQATVPMTTQRDLSLAYSPGVAVPCEDIAENPELAYDYTNKGNLVAVISNGTAVLGLGNLGALGSKPMVSPVWYDWDGTSFFVTGKQRTSYIRNLQRNPRCGFLVEVSKNVQLRTQ